jgi:hypothetical protein
MRELPFGVISPRLRAREACGDDLIGFGDPRWELWFWGMRLEGCALVWLAGYGWAPSGVAEFRFF